MEDRYKLYSQGAISVATYFGGPVAAGILIRKNCMALGKDKQGLNALFIGVLSTILIFLGIFQVPEHIIDKIPNALIPLIYMGIIYLIVEKIQGAELKKHKEDEGEFFSNWRAAGIGGIFSIIILGGIFTFAFLAPADWDEKSYDEGLARFSKNEETALELFNMIDNSTQEEIISFIKNTGIPKWQESMEIFTGLNEIENIPEEAINQNTLLSEYCNLRIEAYELISKAVLLETSEFDSEIIRINNRIDQIVEEL
ncbi:MAG: hypothetical protein ABFS28_15660 [Bacteroidota bacterium]